jgi:hypothetical protein
VDVQSVVEVVVVLLFEMFERVTGVDLPCSAPACNAMPRTKADAVAMINVLLILNSFSR